MDNIEQVAEQAMGGGGNNIGGNMEQDAMKDMSGGGGGGEGGGQHHQLRCVSLIPITAVSYLSNWERSLLTVDFCL